MSDLLWSEAGFTGVAHLWPHQNNPSCQFRSVNRTTGAVEAWDALNLPQMEIPISSGPSLFVECALDVPTGLIAWLFDDIESDAAILAGQMYWIEGGLRIGTINVEPEA